MSRPVIKDRVQDGLDKLITQWQGKPVIEGLLKSYLESLHEIEDVAFQLLDERNLETAIGVQLDNLGTIIGLGRLVEDGAYVKYFGFQGNGVNQPFNVGKFYTEGDPILETKELDDEDYRMYLKAKAAYNSSSGTVNELIDSFKLFIDPNVTVHVEDTGVASAVVIIGDKLTDSERLILISGEKNKLIPRAAGVRFEIKDTAETGMFAFQGNVLAKGFNAGGFARHITTL
jgi:hypothetical protein